MTRPNFATFYNAVQGYAPFPWQERLAEQVERDGWPSTIAVPTGCGKTSVLDVAVYSLASQAGAAALARTAPLRVFFVVDRRLVVDDVSRHARKLAAALSAGGSEAIDWAREQLMSFGVQRPLEVAVLRGGMYRSNSWADTPNQPLVCVSTVDQVGSRLLFRGYGVSDSQRPVHAGLVGNDSLVIVDEAHLSRPFLDTLGWVEHYQTERWREQRGAPGLRFVQMSATVRDSAGAFRLDERDLASENLKPRLEAEKLAELKEVTNLAQDAAAEAIRLANADAVVVGVVLNTVAAARTTFDALRSHAEAILLTGRVRPYDRDVLLEKYLERIRAGRKPRGDARLFVVATQTVEVGADLDFDALVTEAAPLDSLRQRFGRLDRLGELGSTRAVILKPKRAKEKDWVYGTATEIAWKWLQEQAGSPVDFGVRSMEKLASAAEGVNTEMEEGPLIFPAHLDAWGQTNPTPGADPDVAPFLHGRKALDAADVQIVWRADLNGENPGAWVDSLSAAPPVSTEALPVPIWAAKRWLAGTGVPVADLEGIVADGEAAEPTATRPFLIWRGPGKREDGREKSQDGRNGGLRPGETIVLRASEGGCDEFGWNPDLQTAVRDIGDLCANQRTRDGGGKYRMRVHPDVLFPDDSNLRKEFSSLLEDVRNDEAGIEDLRTFVAGTTARNSYPDEARFWKRAKSTGDGGLLVESGWIERPVEPPPTAERAATDETEDDSHTVEMTLAKHTGGVVRKAQTFAAGCGLDARSAAAIATAAEQHDVGKRDHRFQYLLDPRRDPNAEPLAKSAENLQGDVGEVEYSGWPKGARHEFYSLAAMQAESNWQEGYDPELARHLVGTHHGYGRPFPPFWVDDIDKANEVACLDSGWVDQFWKLTRRYGWWGLAYLETVLRRADCVRSREEREEVK